MRTSTILPVILVLFAVSARAQVPPVPDVVWTPHAAWYGPHANSTANLLGEGSSFEVGADDALDGGWWYLERRYYTRWLDANQGGQYMTSFEKPLVVSIPGGSHAVTHGTRCVRLRMRNRSAPQLFGRPFFAPVSGTYTLSLAVLGDAGVPSRPPLSVHLRDVNGKLMANRGTTPSSSWKRLTLTTSTPLEAGKPYYMWIGYGTWEPSKDYPDQSVWIDAIRIAPPGTSSPSTYAHPTTCVSLAGRTALRTTGGLTGRRPFDAFWFGEDEGKRRLLVDVYEQQPIQGTLTLEVYVYDTLGVPTKPATALASTLIPITTRPGAHQTLEVDLDALLQPSGNHRGFYMAVVELKDSTRAWIDRVEVPFVVLKRAPATLPDPDRSPFGGHLLLFRSVYENNQTDFWNIYGIECNATPAEHARMMRDVGCRWTRTFSLFHYEASRYYTQKYPHPSNLAWPPPTRVPGICKEYADLFNVLGMGVTAVFWGPRNNGPYDTCYRNYVREMVTGYMPLGVKHSEVLNEPNHGQKLMEPETYATWLESTRKEADAVSSGFNIVGPVTTYGDAKYTTRVFETRTMLGLGYQCLDVVSYHRYLKGDDSFPWNLLSSSALRSDMRRGPEDAYRRPIDNIPQSSEWEMRAMAGENTPLLGGRLLKPGSLGGGPVDKPMWISEWAGQYPETRCDEPFLHKDEYSLGGFSGSLTLGRRAASRMVRYHVVALAHGVSRLFHWDTLFSRWPLSPWKMAGKDRAPTPALAGFCHMTGCLEGYDFVDSVTVGELPDNGADPYYTRCYVFAERNPANPDRPAAVAVIWNWAGDNYDHLTGSGINDPHDPAPTWMPVTLPTLTLDPTSVEVTDVMGRIFSYSGPVIKNLALNQDPVILRTLPGASLVELMLALDTIRPDPPNKPLVTHDPLLRQVKVQVVGTTPGSSDIRAYAVYREDHGPGTWTRVGEFTPAAGHFMDTPGAGIWRYRVTAIEEYTRFETAPSRESGIVQVFPAGTPRLTVVPESINSVKGGSAFLTFEAGKGNANRRFVLRASLSGHYPGTPVSPAVHLNLNTDPFTVLSLYLAGEPPFVNFAGTLNSEGKAVGEFRVGPGLKLPLAVPVTFVAATLNPLDTATNPAIVVLESSTKPTP